MGNILTHVKFQQRRAELARSDCAYAVGNLRARAEGLQKELAALLGGLAEVQRHLATAKANCTWTGDFCRRARAAYRPDGTADEAAYRALQRDYLRWRNGLSGPVSPH